MPAKAAPLALTQLEQSIHLIRGQKVLLDRDLAALYGVTTSNLNKAVRRNIGIIFQDPTLDGGLTAQENLSFHAMMYHVPREERRARINAALEMVELTDVKFGMHMLGVMLNLTQASRSAAQH